jgi:glucosamine--fructose-6-phosphate aminotransferase (isomerizing)
MVLDVVTRASAAGSPTIIVTGEPARLGAADIGIDIRAGDEQVGAKTKGYTSTVLTLRLVVAALAGVSADLDHVPGAVDSALEAGDAAAEFAQHIDAVAGIAILGSGPHLATAREAALKIAEIARIDAQAFDVEEYIHGPHRRLTAASAVAIVAVDSPIFDRSVALVGWLGTVTERVLVITDRPADFGGTTAVVIGIDPVGEDLSTVPAIIPLQRLALGCAAVVGVDPEQPLFAEVDGLLARKDAVA